MNKPCPFCNLPAARILGGDELAFIASDGFPVSPGHALIIPRRHVGSFFESTPSQESAGRILAYHGASLILPQSREYLPQPEFLDWHRKQVFKSPQRPVC